MKWVRDTGQTAFWGFEIAGSWNLISVLMTNVTLSLKWHTVTLKLKQARDMGQTAFWGFEIVASWNLISILMSDVTVTLKWLTVTLKIETD